MQNYVPIIESVLIGFALLSAINHFIHAGYLANRKLHLLFALLAATCAAHESATLSSYYAYSIDEMIRAQFWRINFAFLFILIFPWFLAMYTGVKPVRFIVALSISAVAILLANLAIPSGIALSQFESVFSMQLPWGESIARAQGTMGPWLLFGYALAFTEIGFAYYAGSKQYRNGETTAAIALMCCMAVFTLLLVVNYFVSVQVIPFLYTVGYAFLALILAMSFCLSGRIRDINEKVADYERRLHNLLDNTEAVVYAKDLEGKYRMVNRRFEEVCLVKQENLEGKTDADIFPASVAQRFMENDAFVLSSGTGMEFEEILRQPDGEHLYHSIKMPMKGQDGKVFGLFGISTDITAQKQVQNEIQARDDNAEQYFTRRNQELVQANSELEAFCSAVSHDLRSPLNSIFGYSQMLLRSYGDALDTQGMKFLKTIESSSREMNQLISALLELSRISREEIKVKHVDLTKLAWKAISELEVSNSTRKINMHIQDGLAADGDEHLLQIAMTNLISNAWKYSASTDNASIEVGAIVTGGEKAFFVKDNGAGFDMQDADKLFIPFKRLHTAEHFTGSGIGLSTVERIINHHKGKIWAQSEPGRGATFYFTLWSPVEKAENRTRLLRGAATTNIN